VFRIAPLYLVAVIAMFMIVLTQTDFQLAVPVRQLIGQVSAWLALGALTAPDVNGYPGTTDLLAGVTWTLQYEWAFYCSLPILAVAARQGWLHLPVSAAGFLVSLVMSKIYGVQLIFAALFFMGMTSASIHASGLNRALPDHFASFLAVGLIAGTMFLYPTAYAVEPVVLLGIGFHLIASGGSIFGLLLTRPAQRLGHISYGIYILQGLALAVVLRPTASIAVSSPIWHWLLVLAAAVLLVGVSAVLHVLIERPGIAFGKTISVRLTAIAPRLGFLLRAPSR
jgi:peptidoglycan/LPS O-acetylase OafA/YrhL